MSLPTTIKVSTATWIHVLLVLAQILNLISGQVPEKYQVFVAAGLALIQLVVGKLQHNSPPPSAPASGPSVSTK